MAKISRPVYAILFLIFLAGMILFLMFKPEWFWVMLPFVGTSIVKALDII